MRQPAPTDASVVLTIGASDPQGATGIQADLKTIEAHGAYGTSVVTAVDAGASSQPVGTADAQLAAVRSAVDIQAMKTGRLVTDDQVATVADHAAASDCPVVVDLAAIGGGHPDHTETLLAEATLGIVNVDSAEWLTGIRPEDEAGQRLVGQRLLTRGADAALVTGGDAPSEEVLDTLVTPDSIETATHTRIDVDAIRGAGDALGAAITARLALGEPLPDAVGKSLSFVHRGLRYPSDVGDAPVVNHGVDVRDAAARDQVREQVEDVVAWFVDRDVSPIVPEVGLQVVGATPYADSPADCAAVEGRITRVRDGVHPNRSVRFGVSEHVAQFLITAREHEPELRYAVNCRFNDEIRDAVNALGWAWVEFDPSNRQTPDESRLEREAEWAFSGRDEPPIAVADPGAVGIEPILKVVGADHRKVAERVVTLVETVASE